MTHDLHDDDRDQLGPRQSYPGRPSWTNTPRPRDNTRAGLIVVGMLCATAVLISFACAFALRALG